ncbi:MAG: twin-arginine translocase subunit TatC [Pseudomonadota bacterium]
MSEKKSGEGPNLSFMDHLRELRRRLWIGLVLVFIAVAVAFVFRSTIIHFLIQPFIVAWDMVEGLPEKPSLSYMNPLEFFLVDLKVALLSGIFCGLPFLLWQVWLFVAPGLYRKEKKYAYPFLLLGYPLFFGGAAFCYYVILPMVFQFGFSYTQKFAGTMSEDIVINPLIMIREYAAVTIKLLMGFGIAFELPLAIVILTLLGIVNWKILLRFSKYFLVLAFVIGAVLTPPDVVSQLFLAAPLIVLYFASVLVSFILRPGTGEEKKRKKAKK